ncbi:M20/M25/M40 family metallo-hydrolase [Rhodospirillales bacterium]|nr:M20/M25/M40 family metallo-hydrolase [Rhodospirillales bacterium]
MDISPSPSREQTLLKFSLPDRVCQLSIEIFSKLQEVSFDAVGVSRETYGPSKTAAFELLVAYALKEGLEVEWDAARNLIIRLPGENPELASVATGSHLDSVPEGGNYDGAAGVIAGLVVLIASKDEGARQRSMEVIAVRGEESAWFGGPCYFGSQALFGQLTENDFNSPHRDGTRTLED